MKCEEYNTVHVQSLLYVNVNLAFMKFVLISQSGLGDRLLLLVLRNPTFEFN
jgi:hypothetical protein